MMLKRGLMLNEELKEFAADTTAHGVRYIFHGNRLLIKAIFFIFWILAVGFCIGRSSMCVQKFLQKKTSTRYSMHPASASAIMDFPTVTICNYNRVRRSYLQDKPKLKKLLGYVYNFNWTALNDPATWQGEFKPYENYTYHKVLSEGEMWNATFVSCTQGYVRYCQNTTMGPDYFTRDLDMVSGSCFRINPQGNLKGKSGEYGVLSLYLIADTQEYIESDISPGWILATHEHGQYGSSLDSGTKIAPGFLYSFNINTMNVHSHEKHCGPSIGRKSAYGRFDQAACLLDCRDAYFNNTCGCLNTLPPENIFGYRECNLKEFATCGYEAYVKYVQWFSDVEKEQLDCDCDVVACRSTLFKSSMSASPISNEEADHKLSKWKNEEKFKRFNITTMEDLQKNVAIVEVYFGSSLITDVEEVIAYDFDNLLGDIGGVMGLFLGASIFTIMEFMNLFGNLFVTLFSHLAAWKQKRQRMQSIASETTVSLK